jgi:hypothetical protein
MQPRRKEKNRDDRKENYEKGEIYPCGHSIITGTVDYNIRCCFYRKR